MGISYEKGSETSTSAWHMKNIYVFVRRMESSNYSGDK